MVKYFRTIGVLTISLAAVLALSSCSFDSQSRTSGNDASSQLYPDGQTADSLTVNIYTDRHYDTDDAIYQSFTEETGIQVNIVKGKSDELIERLNTEGSDTEADLFITADVSRLHRAKTANLLQPVTSSELTEHIPENLRDIDNYWFGLTRRARVIVYAKDRIDPAELSSYADLTDPRWRGRLLVRGSDSVYNQTLLSSIIVIEGEQAARSWTEGIVANMARHPRGGDRDQATAIVAGEGDIAIMNTYYVGLMLNSSDPAEREVAEQIGVFFPDQDGQGTHVNVSGAGVTLASRNKQNAVRLLEFLLSPEVQQIYAETNYEYPVREDVQPAELLRSWGAFKPQMLSLSQLGETNEIAVRIMTESGWR